MLTKDLPKIAAADLALSDGLVGDTAGKGTGLIPLDEAMKFLDSKRGCHVNPNLLINWDFRKPVNRNGKSEYTGAGHTIDMWRIHSGAQQVTLQNNGLALTALPNANFYYKQTLSEETFSGLLNQTVTLSFLLGNNEFVTATGKIPNGSVRFLQKPYSQGVVFMEKDSVANRLSAFISVTPANTTVAVAAKLELGDQQTLAHQDADGNWVLNDPLNYDLQYALCSQYSPSTGEFVGSQHSNPNLLDNWYFVDPINQRGQEVYTSSGYVFDSWLIGSGLSSVSLTDGGILLESNPDPAVGGRFLGQRLYPALIAALQKKVVTISVLIKGRGCFSLGNYNSTLALRDVDMYSDDYILMSGSYTFPSDNNQNHNTPHIYVNSGSVALRAMKLELGPVQTLARKEGDTWVLNDPPPDYGQELAKCQRYQLFGKDIYSIPGIGTSNLLTRGQQIFLPTPVKMRATPTIVGEPHFFDVETGEQVTGLTIQNIWLQENGICFNVVGSTRKVNMHFGNGFGNSGLDANL